MESGRAAEGDVADAGKDALARDGLRAGNETRFRGSGSGSPRALRASRRRSAVGVASPVGSRWFREAGGMRPISLAPLSSRYLSFAEREEIAIFKAEGCGVREIARQVGRTHRRSAGSCAVTQPPGRTRRAIGRFPPSGMPIDEPGGPR